MTIEIIDQDLITDDDDGTAYWSLVIEITDNGNSYLLAVGEPGATAEGDLQTSLEGRETQLLATAEAKGVTPDVTFSGSKLKLTNKVIKALALLLLDEINILRAEAGLPLRTESQIRGGIKNKLKSLL